MSNVQPSSIDQRPPTNDRDDPLPIHTEQTINNDQDAIQEQPTNADQVEQLNHEQQHTNSNNQEQIISNDHEEDPALVSNESENTRDHDILRDGSSFPSEPPLQPLVSNHEHKHPLRIYAIPAKNGEWYFLVQWPKPAPGKFEKFNEKQKKKMVEAKPSTIRGKIWTRYKKSVAKESPTTKMVKRLPRSVDWIEFVYPANMNAGPILGEIQNELKKKSKAKKWATILSGIALPICVVIDILTIGFLLTLGDLIFFLASLRAWRGTRATEIILRDPGPAIMKEKLAVKESTFLETFLIKSRQRQLTDADFEELRRYTRDPEIEKTLKKLIAR